MYIDLDNDPETGSTIEFDYDILWEGIDAFVYSTGDIGIGTPDGTYPVSYTHLRAHET